MCVMSWIALRTSDMDCMSQFPQKSSAKAVSTCFTQLASRVSSSFSITETVRKLHKLGAIVHPCLMPCEVWMLALWSPTAKW